MQYKSKIVYREPVTGPPGIVHWQSAISNKLAPKPAPKPNPTLTLTLPLPNPNPKLSL